MTNKRYTIIHQVSLVSIGGVQKSFISYINNAHKKSNYSHLIFTNNNVDKEYSKYIEIPILKLNNPFNLIFFCFHLLSNKSIIHFYNNISSKKIFYLLRFIKANNIIFHERGNAWNQTNDRKGIYLKNSKKADLIICNSIASKKILTKKFGVDPSKIRIVYNGVIDQIPRDNENFKKANFTVGYLGRLDTNKGVNIFINAAKKLKKYNFIIAGEGPLKNFVISNSNEVSNLNFVGRIYKVYEFLSSLDILVVPSIREPYGNVIVEAGAVRTPVIASYIDGIQEIIDDNISGRLIIPTDNLDQEITKINKVLPYPESVINNLGEIDNAKQINLDILVDEIDSLLNDKDSQKKYADNLFHKVTNINTISEYSKSLEKVYKEILEK